MSKLLTTSNFSGNAIGPNVLLKVMGGDKLNATANYYYEIGVNNTYDITSNIVNTLIGGFAGSGISDIAKNQVGAIQSSLSSGGLDVFFNNRPAPGSGIPKAYLNYLFFDENFNAIPGFSGAVVVDNNTQASLTLASLKAPKNGYAYIYLSNESNLPVYFDDFQVSHERGAIIEETHYYPTGLKIASLCSKAFNKLPNRYGYQGDYSEEETESGYDEFDLRMYDPQIARWIQSDPYDEFASGYIGMGNDPVNNVDPSGGEIGPGGLGAIIGSISGAISGFSIAKSRGENFWTSVAWGAAASFIGAGLGYGIGESVWGTNGGGFVSNTIAFYKGFFGGEGNVNTVWNRYNNPTNTHVYSVPVPKIWGGLQISIGKISKIKKIEVTYFDLDIRPSSVIGGILRDGVPPNVNAPLRICPCQLIPVIVRPAIIRTIGSTRPFSDDQSDALDGRISDEQFDALQTVIQGVRRQLLPGGTIRNGRISVTFRANNLALNFIPTPDPLSGAGISINPSTLRRTGTFNPVGVFSPVVSRGQTVLQIYTSQIGILNNILSRRLGLNISAGVPTTTGTSGSISFRGIMTRGALLTLIIRCRCN